MAESDSEDPPDLIDVNAESSLSSNANLTKKVPITIITGELHLLGMAARLYKNALAASCSDSYGLAGITCTVLQPYTISRDFACLQ